MLNFILLHSLLRIRKCGWIMDPNRTIEIEKILRFLEAARWAPSLSVSIINPGGL